MARAHPVRSSTHHRALALVASLAASLAGARSSAAQGACEPAIEYGMNPSFQTWSSRAIVFADAFQRVREISRWSGAPAGAAPLLAPGSGVLGAGWPDPAQLAPGERCGAYLFGSMEGTLPDGRVDPYVVTWSGAGSARLEGPYVVSEQSRGPNRVEVLVDPSAGTDAVLSVSWTATDPADPVRDVHVWLPRMERAQRIFWPPFLAKLRAMNAGRGPHTWRTLDWTRVNEYGRSLAGGGFVFDLAGVIKPTSPSQGTPRGVAPEYCVALCNALGTNLHLQLPHRTSQLSESDYAAFLAEQLRLVRDGSPGVPGLYGGRAFAGLDPSLTVTVELSNEMWNSGMPVHAWMSAEAARKGISPPQQVASQVQLLFDTADAVFSGPNAPRLRKFVGGFGAGPTFADNVLASLRPGTRVDALGPAAYLGPRRPDMDAWLVGATTGSCPSCPTPDELIALAYATVDVLRPLLAQHRAVAQSWTNPDGSHPALELYEAGLNLKSANHPWAAASRAVQRDPRLFDVFVSRYVPMLVEEGVSLVNWYSFMSDQDSTLVDAYGQWNDMQQSITLPVQVPPPDEGAPKAAVICLGPPLGDACPRASAVARNAPTNAAVYTTTVPVLGRTLRASVDLAAAGASSAFVFASTSAASLVLPSGDVLLAALGGATFLPPRSGASATWDVSVPNDPALAGLVLATQAVLTGGAPGVRMTNAMDLTLGR